MRRLCPIHAQSIIDQMRSRYDVRIRRWRISMSGCAWSTLHLDGRRFNWIESPYPKTPISLAIFLHEVGHHAIGFSAFERQCEEEYHVWRWAIDRMHELGVEPDESALRRVELSMRYELDKALRRGMRIIPDALSEYATAA
jgi:hypothetical protein